METGSSYILGKTEVEKLIPQKAPFAMVDTLLKFSELQITSGFTVTKENILSKNGVFTEPGIIEHLAQTMALHSGYKIKDATGKPQTGYIGAIKKVEIFNLPNVGDQLETTATIVTEFMGITLVTMICKCKGQLIAEAEMKIVVVD